MIKFHRHAAFISVAILAVVAFWPHPGRANAPSGRYTVSNEWIKDEQTQLTWEKIIFSLPLTWSEANDYCATLDLDGTGWRLPSLKELQTIIDESKAHPAIDPVFLYVPNHAFWTSSSLVDGPPWFVNFDYGLTGFGYPDTMLRFRCVR